MSLRALGDRVHVGVRRSPLAAPKDVLALARTIRATSGVELVGVLGYEAQIAGLPDDDPDAYDHYLPVGKAAVRRVASADVPVPFTPVLENAYRPDVPRIVAAHIFAQRVEFGALTPGAHCGASVEFA